MSSDPRLTQTIVPGESSLSQVRIFAPGSRIGQRYEIESVLGAGGSAVVYAALDRELNRRVALKVLRADRISPTSLRRFRREVAIARDASSPRLVRVFDIGEAGEGLFLTMELVEGRSLRQLLEDGPLPIERCLSIARDVLEALRELHRLDIVHRDVKPANVLIGKAGEVKLGDFGLARYSESVETRATETDAIVGTVAYLSPEQALGKDVDARSDLYSFGILLFEILTGRLPFENSSSLGTVVAHINNTPAGLRTLRPDAPRWLASVVRRLLAKRPEERYASVDAVLADIERQTFTGKTATRGLAFFLVLMAATVAASQVRARWQATRFAEVVDDSQGGARAVDGRGRTLWTRPDLKPGNLAATIRRPDGTRAVATVLNDSTDVALNRNLVLLDGQSGSAVGGGALADGSVYFEGLGFTRRFGVARVVAVDLDSDGADEVLVTYSHYPYWPSYTVMYEPESGQSFIVFLGTGHHHFSGAVDLDGDGRKELILVGPNNRMGWYTGIAAVSVRSLVGRGVSRDTTALAACTPDAECAERSSGLWYKLGPYFRAGRFGAFFPLMANLLGKTLSFDLGGRALRLDFSGNPFDPAIRRQERERGASREETYRSLRLVSRLSAAGNLEAALDEIRNSRKWSARAFDTVLSEWVGRVEGSILVREGLAERAESLFTELSRDPAAPRDIFFDAGRAFHLAGDLPRAVGWYRRGLGTGAVTIDGRPKYEYLEGMILALAEMERWVDAQTELDRYDATYPEDRSAVHRHRQWVRWLGRGDPGPTNEGFGDGTDLCRYWALEFRAAAKGADLGAVLRDVEKSIASTSQGSALFRSLRAELLNRLGRKREALPAARESLSDLVAALPTDIAARAHLKLATARFSALAEGAGLSEEAGRARRATASLLWGPGKGARHAVPDRTLP